MPRLLIIDDDDMFRAMLREMLEEAHVGYEVVDANSSETGVALFQKRQFDLIITDMFMPPGGGLGVIKQVRAMDKKIGIILISGMLLDNRDEIFKHALATGASRTLEKPVRQSVLLQTVSELLAETQNTDSD